MHHLTTYKMKSQISIIIAVGILVFSTCTSERSDNPGPAAGSNNSVERIPPNSSYTPWFAGQTRISAVSTTTRYVSRVVTQDLQSPWGITSLPDGRLLITEKAGQMRIVSLAGELGWSILGLPRVNSAGQGGLLGVTIDPDFEVNRMVYWVFSQPVSGGSLTAVAKGRLSDNESRMENPTVIYQATPAYTGSLHYGGRIVFDPAGNLLVSTGERSDMSTRPQAQSLNSALGKIVRITTNGEPAVGDPFAGQQGSRPEIFSLGHRNPQGLAIHPLSGDLWQSEHGPRGGDEINRVSAGANYGWPIITYGLEYSGARVGEGIQQRQGLTQPAYYWDPVVSPSGMTFYDSDNIPEWQNNLFIGSLSGQHIIRLVIEENRVTGEERLLEGEGQRFRDMEVGMDGALYTITDQGRLYRIDVD